VQVSMAAGSREADSTVAVGSEDTADKTGCPSFEQHEVAVRRGTKVPRFLVAEHSGE
jgi:hypothetical protein